MPQEAEAAQAAGFDSIKINCVVERGVNEDQVLPLIEHFRGSGHVVRFIEYMDVGTCNGWALDRVVPSAQLRDRIAARWPLRPLDPNYRGEVAARYAFVDGQGEVAVYKGLTQPVTRDDWRALEDMLRERGFHYYARDVVRDGRVGRRVVRKL